MLDNKIRNCNVCGGYTWMTFKEKIPSFEEWVLFWYVAEKESGVIKGQLSFYEPGKFWSGHDYLDLNRVTHWMPLPNPPEV